MYLSQISDNNRFADDGLEMFNRSRKDTDQCVLSVEAQFPLKASGSGAVPLNVRRKL